MGCVLLTKEESRMRDGRLLKLCASVLFGLLAASLAGQEQTPTNIQTQVIEDFTGENGVRWTARGSNFIADGYPRAAYVATGPDALYTRRGNDNERSSFGVNAAFNRTGFNYLQLVPVQENEDGEDVPVGIPIPGVAETIDMWVWGSNRNMYVDAHLRDYRGVDHVIRMGDIAFNGWRNLTAHIPSRIPQTASTLPRFRELELTRLVVWTRPGTPVDDFYVYVDEIRVLTDLYESPFDGEELADPERVEQLWDETDVEEFSDDE